MKITKTFTFDAGHRLMRHDGLCHNLHGHTYHLEVTIDGPLDEYTGMIIDFKDLKALVKKHIDPLDHAMILNAADKDVIDFCNKNEYKVFIIPEEPTAENIAFRLKMGIMRDLTIKGFSIKVKLHETPTSFVEA